MATMREFRPRSGQGNRQGNGPAHEAHNTQHTTPDVPMPDDTRGLLPQNVEAEAGLLGSILIDPAHMADVAPLLQPHDFYAPQHQAIYGALLDMWRSHRPIDLITLVDRLTDTGALDSVGGASYVSSLANQVPHSRQAETYARMVAGKALLRRLITAAGEIASEAYQSDNPATAIEVANVLLMNAALGYDAAGNDSMPLADSIDEFLRQCDASIEQGMMPGVMTGITELDAHLVGLQRGELAYLCGRPGSGKSAVAASIAVTVANATQGKGDLATVEWVSLEMSHVQQVKRLVTSWARVNGRVIRAAFRRPDGTINTEAYQATQDAANQLKAAIGQRLRLYDRAMTIEQLCQHVRRAAARRGVALLVVDYLGLLESEDARVNDYQRIGKISRELKQLALELNIPILCLVQMNRKCEDRANKRPELSDLRDNGGLEQDADIVIGVYRGAYYNHALSAVDEHFREFGELLVLKAREGEANVVVPFRFEGEYTRPSDWPQEWACDAYLKTTASSGGSGEAD